ncbi:hypothetical protein GCM10007424_03490 [Flavobacterium suaedae]|uniref:Uncharacterized protein n=1 Tax=Flavobacterium suaedae TaxID=1767027 RepID=A0ABQ1JI01_9FLAO|nr:hypothetical protein [Flavobacterium suaedae]GGB66804.1 hypothetical protein GCM10007424_03490 [Flavobacterium suaedae]
MAGSDFVIEVITEVILPYPGAFIRWLFLGRKRTFKSILKEANSKNEYVTLAFVMASLLIFLII